jgi:prevent-host-death family protein
MEDEVATIGVRELKEQTSKVLRRVRERGEEIEVTHHGRVIARLVPAKEARPRARTTAAAWATLDQIAREIGARWPKGRSAAKAVKEGRRAL